MSAKDLDTRRGLLELAALSLRLGVTAFGGPAAHIAMLEDEAVRRRGWLTEDEFLDLMGATNLIPGPNSTEMVIHVGHRRAGFPGLLVAGSCFILPAALIVGLLAWAYVTYGTLPQAAGILYGVKPVVLVIVLQALWRLGQKALRTKLLSGAAAMGVALSVAGVHELAVLLGIGLLCMLFAETRGRPTKDGEKGSFSLPALPAIATASAATASAATFGLWPLFLFFAKVGTVLFGSGYVLLAFLRADLVDRWQWLTENQLLDAVAVGQVTPGPVFTTATFIGYVLGGTPGALVATAGIFLPAFCFVAISGPLVPRLRQSRLAAGFLDGVNAASLALMATVTFHLGRAAFVDWAAVGLGVAAAVLLLRYKINTTWLIAGSAALGYFLGS